MKVKINRNLFLTSMILILVFLLPIHAQVTQDANISENVGTQTLSRPIRSMDPGLMLAVEPMFGMNVYENLVKWDQDKGLIPVLAKSWESNEKKDIWIFHLRENVTFHDGTPFTAKAVKYSLQRVIDLGVAAYNLKTVEKIEIIDDLNIRIKLSAPRNLPLILTSIYGLYIYNPNSADKPKDWFDKGNDAGTGPYVVESYDNGQQRIVLSQYKNYWRGWKEGQFTKVVFEYIQDVTVREQMIRSGEVDITDRIPFVILEMLKKVDGVKVETADSPLPVLFCLYQLDKPPLDNIKVRQALNYAFPYDIVKTYTYNGMGKMNASLVPDDLLPPGDLPRYKYNLKKAKALLDEAGLKKGTKIKIAVNAAEDTFLQIAMLWQAELSKIGINLMIEKSTAIWEIMKDTETEYHIEIKSWGPGYASPYEYLIFYDYRNTFAPFTGFKSDDLNNLLDQALAAEAVSREESNKLFLEVEKILYDKALGLWIMSFPTDHEVRSDIMGFKMHPFYWASDWYEYMRK